MQPESLTKQVFKAISNIFITVPEAKYLGTILLGAILLGFAVLIIKLLV